MSTIPTYAVEGFDNFLDVVDASSLRHAQSVGGLIRHWLDGGGGTKDCGENFEAYLITLLRIQAKWCEARRDPSIWPDLAHVPAFTTSEEEFVGLTDPYAFQFACANYAGP